MSTLSSGSLGQGQRSLPPRQLWSCQEVGGTNAQEALGESLMGEGNSEHCRSSAFTGGLQQTPARLNTHRQPLQIHLFQCCVQSHSGRKEGNSAPHSGSAPLCPQGVPTTGSPESPQKHLQPQINPGIPQDSSTKLEALPRPGVSSDRSLHRCVPKDKHTSLCLRGLPVRWGNHRATSPAHMEAHG